MVGVEPLAATRAGRRCASPSSAPVISSTYARACAVADVAGVLELLERVLADGLEHAEAAVGTGQQAVVGERGDPVERLRPAHRLGGCEREAAGEHAELG